MNINELIKDSVFQLNLLLWMAKEQPADHYRVRPLFYQLGFRIVYIEQPFAFPIETIKAIQYSALDISEKPEPEMILGRDRDKKALYFEAKSNSFSPDSSNAKQARGHLMACGDAFAEVMTPYQSSLLCYLTPDDRRAMMADCLNELADQLKQEGLKPGEYSTHGLSRKEGELIYSWDEHFKSCVHIREDNTSIMSGISDDVNPTPLVLLYSDEDHYDPAMQDYYRQVIIEQVRAAMLCELHAHPLQTNYFRTPDQLLKRTSGGFFSFYGRERSRSVRRLVKQDIFKRIVEQWKDKQPGIQLSGDELRIYWTVSGEKDAFLNWLEDRRTHFPTGKAQLEPHDEGQLEFDIFQAAGDDGNVD